MRATSDTHEPCRDGARKRSIATMSVSVRRRGIDRSRLSVRAETIGGEPQMTNRIEQRRANQLALMSCVVRALEREALAERPVIEQPTNLT